MSKLKLLMMIAVTAFDVAVCASVMRGADTRSQVPEKVRNEMRAGFGGDGAALGAGMHDLNSVLAQDPKNAEAMAWHGAGITFHSGELFRAGDYDNATPLFDKGLREMEDAVRLEPDNPAVTSIRGAVLLKASAAMPESDEQQQLLQQGLADSVKSYDELKPFWDHLNNDVKGRMLTDIADGYARSGKDEKAAEFYKQAQSELKGTEYADQASRWLQSHSK